MEQDQRKNSGQAPLLGAWIKSSTDFWKSMADMWSQSADTAVSPEQSKKDGKTRIQESMESALKRWETLSFVMGDPGIMDGFLKGVNALPDVFVKMMEKGWESCFQLQKQWMEKAGNVGKTTEAYKFEDLDKETLEAWRNLYQKELRHFFNVPQLGLTRVYQERAAKTVDKYNLFQGAMAEFLHILYLPAEKSIHVMQDEVAKMAENDSLPENPNQYYGMWIKILEGHTMTLFQSSEYTEVLGRTTNAMEDFLMAREEVLQDVLQTLPIPTNKDMDALYKDFYELKRKVRELAGKLAE